LGAESGRQGGFDIYAIVRSGGKQYRVEPDQIIDVDRLPADVGSTVDLNDVLLVAVNGDVHIGRPTLEGARVVAEVVEHSRDAKIVVFKYKAKTRYHRRRGHRQGYTRLAVRQILTEEAPAGVEEKPKRRRAAKEQADAETKPARRPRMPKQEPAAETVEAAVEAPETVAKPARRRPARKAEAEARAAEAPSVEAPEAEAKPARRPRARKPASESEAESPQKARRRSTRKIETESD